MTHVVVSVATWVRHHHSHLALLLCLGLLATTVLALASGVHDPRALKELRLTASDLLREEVRAKSSELLDPEEMIAREVSDIEAFLYRVMTYIISSVDKTGESWVKVVDVVRLRQVRVSSEDHNLYSLPCDWSQQDVRPRPFPENILLTMSAWNYTSQTGLPQMRGRYCYIPEDGYYLDLYTPSLFSSHPFCQDMGGSERDCAVEFLHRTFLELEEGHWLDDLTRTVTLSLTLFDFRAQLMCIVNVMWENLALSSWWLTPDIVPIAPRGAMTFHVLVFILVIAFIILDLMSAQHHRNCKTACNLTIDVVLFITLAVHLNTHAQASDLVDEANSKFLHEYTNKSEMSNVKYVGIERLVKLQHRFAVLETIWAMGALLKGFSLDWYGLRTFTRIVVALRNTFANLFSFLILIILLQFFLAGVMYLQFGTHIDRYSTLAQSFSSVARITLGDYDYNEFVSAGVEGQVVFILLTSMLFILLTQYLLSIFFSAVEMMRDQEDEDEKSERSAPPRLMQDEKTLQDPERKVFMQILREELITLRKKH